MLAPKRRSLPEARKFGIHRSPEERKSDSASVNAKRSASCPDRSNDNGNRKPRGPKPASECHRDRRCMDSASCMAPLKYHYARGRDAGHGKRGVDSLHWVVGDLQLPLLLFMTSRFTSGGAMTLRQAVVPDPVDTSGGRFSHPRAQLPGTSQHRSNLDDGAT